MPFQLGSIKGLLYFSYIAIRTIPMSISKKRELFSNIYSPNNKSSLSKTLQTRRDKTNLTPIKTQRSHREHVVASIPAIQTYRHSSKLTLTQDGMRKILKQLQIQAQVRRSLQQRIKARDLYLKYDMNPFLKEFDQANKGQKQQTNDINIIEAITQSSNKLLRSKMKEKLETYENKSQQAYNFHLKKRLRQQSKISQGKLDSLIWKKQQTPKAKPQQINHLQQLNDIIKLNQISYFQRQYKKRQHNIFQLVYRNQQNFLSSRETLNKYYFCHDSIHTHSQKSGPSHKLILEEISIFSRDMIRRIKSKYISDRIALSEIDLNLEVDKLSFNDIMLVNTGRVSSKVLLSYLQGEQVQKPRRNLEQDDESTSEKQIQYPILYADNTINNLTHHNPVLISKADISEYNKIQRSPYEKKQQELSIKFQQKLKRLINLQRNLVSNTIKDKGLLVNINAQKDRVVLQQIEQNADTRYNLDLKEIERRMRLNKIGKNRAERIKIDMVKETLIMKKKQEVRKSAQRRKSISPNATLRK